MGNYINKTDKENFRFLRVSKLHMYDSEKQKHVANTFEHENFDKKKKKLIPFEYFNKKQFKEYIKSLPEDYEVSVIGNVFINQRKYKNITEEYTIENKLEDKNYGCLEIEHTRNYVNKNKEKLQKKSNLDRPFNYKNFDLKEAKETKKNLFMRTVGYAEVGKDEYVRLVKRSFIPLILFGILLLSLLFVIFFDFNPPENPDPGKEDGSIIEEIYGDDKDDYKLPVNYVFPQFQDFTVTSEKTNIGLYNPKDNNKGIQFYLNKDKTDVLKDKDGKAITEEVDSSLWLGYTLKEGDKVIFETSKTDQKTGKKIRTYIEPGKQVSVNLYELLSAGTHTISIEVNSYSFDDKQECTSYNDDVIITVLK